MVAAALNIVLTPREKENIEKIPTKNMLAYEFDLKADDLIEKWRFSRDTTFLRLALNLYDQALKLDPEYTGALSGKSWVYAEGGKFDSALYYIEEFRKINPDDIAVSTGKGLIYLYSGKSDSSLKYYGAAIEKAPNDHWLNLAMGQLTFVSKNQPIEGLLYMQKAFDLGGYDDVEINRAISWVFYNVADYDKASEYLKKGISLRSECRLLMDNCYILYAQGKYKKALMAVDSTCNINPCEMNCDMMKFYIYTTLKEYEKAEECYKKAVGYGYKGTEEADIYLACLYNNTGRRKEALSILNRSIKTDEGLLTTNSNPLIVKARLCAAYAMLGNKKKVWEYLPYLETSEYFLSDINFLTFPGFDNLRNEPEFVKYFKDREEEKSSIRKKIKEMEKRGEIHL